MNWKKLTLSVVFLGLAVGFVYWWGTQTFQQAKRSTASTKGADGMYITPSGYKVQIEPAPIGK